ncbi:hypothetical protein FFLO_04756 [Filobasidium floriforme]|uniref:DUF427 domain-containing protein n=1 Tax=Filobasidium floriforme TaxID=5210 RepID=A0A8K0JIA1_9TREE|nr:uncharacterized protein HD553DRAFT_335973 [Filobasidium floriforme]KAG7530849.1 hypothetical protein FFLO_04756 [Filobasidium floriforme]KAH8082540.1 hypothetical protein HD553DRAFT_335973 [Filobasidium floriforme]
MSASTQIAVLLENDVLVSCDETDAITVEGNFYFPEQNLKHRERFEESGTHTTCGWKGEASYYNYKREDGTVLKDIAWFYPKPKSGAEQVAQRVAFYVGKQGLKIGEPSVDAPKI